MSKTTAGKIKDSKAGRILPNAEHAKDELIANVQPRRGFTETVGTQQTHIHQSKSGLELPRKAFHSSVGRLLTLHRVQRDGADCLLVVAFVVMALWYLHTPIIYSLYVLGTGLAVISLADVWRFNSPWFAVRPVGLIF